MGFGKKRGFFSDLPHVEFTRLSGSRRNREKYLATPNYFIKTIADNF